MNLSSSISILMSMLILLSNIHVAHALSATTANTIQGTEPTLLEPHLSAVNNGDDFELLGIRFDNNSYFTEAEVKTRLNTLDQLFGSLTPNSLSKKLGDNTNGIMSAAYKNPVSSTDVSDNDGDGFTNNALSGTANTKWYFKNGNNEYELSSDSLDKSFCHLASLTPPVLPYIKIQGPVDLTTEYGDLNKAVYDINDPASPIYTKSSNPVRRYYPVGLGEICFAKPNLDRGTGNYVGPTTMWDPQNGFIPQSAGKEDFPTTGANNLYFDLIITGIDAHTLKWGDASVAGESSKIVVGNIIAMLKPKSRTEVEVKLLGPDVTRSTSDPKVVTGDNAPFPSVLPALFLIEGKDNLNNVKVDYKFTINKWSVNRGSTKDLTSGFKSWCKDLDSNTDVNKKYNFARSKDFSNAKNDDLFGGGGEVPQNPNGNYYWRHIGCGLLGECNALYRCWLF